MLLLTYEPIAGLWLYVRPLVLFNSIYSFSVSQDKANIDPINAWGCNWHSERGHLRMVL